MKKIFILITMIFLLLSSVYAYETFTIDRGDYKTVFAYQIKTIPTYDIVNRWQPQQCFINNQSQEECVSGYVYKERIINGTRTIPINIKRLGIFIDGKMFYNSYYWNGYVSQWFYNVGDRSNFPYCTNFEIEKKVCRRFQP